MTSRDADRRDALDCTLDIGVASDNASSNAVRGRREENLRSSRHRKYTC